MSVLRLYCPLAGTPSQCEWVVIANDGHAAPGRGPLKSLPRADRVELVIPAADMVITRTQLPSGSQRSQESVLAFAIEERTVSDPAANRVHWLAATGSGSVLAVLDRQGLQRWAEALANAGIHRYDIFSEMLLLPWSEREWGLAWNGEEGFVRFGSMEAVATDTGDAANPPLSLRLLIEQSARDGKPPQALAVHPAAGGTGPDVEAWRAKLGIEVSVAGDWDWRRVPVVEAARIARSSSRRTLTPAVAKGLRAAAWIAGVALVAHALALAVDWGVLAAEQRDLRRDMTQRFRATFPEAVAIVDPVIQMRRKLAESRHAAGLADPGDFLPMVEALAFELKDWPPDTVRVLSYESGRISLELAVAEPQKVEDLAMRLRRAGMEVDRPVSQGPSTHAVLTVRIA